MRIRTKMLGLNFVILAGFAVMTLVTFLSLGHLRELNDLSRDGLRLTSHFHQVAILGRDLLITNHLEAAREAWTARSEEFSTAFTAFSQNPVMLDLLAAGGKGGMLESFQRRWATSQTQMAEVSDQVNVLVQRQSGVDFAASVVGLMMGYQAYGDAEFVSTALKVQVLTTSQFETLTVNLADMVTEVEAAVANAERQLVIYLLALGGAVSVIALAFFIIVTRGIGRQLYTVLTSMDLLTKRDFTVKVAVRGRDEFASIAGAVNQFIDDFSSVINGVKTIAAEAATLKNEVTTAAIESAASVTEMSANLDSMNSRIAELVENLNQSNRAVKTITDSVSLLASQIEEQSSSVARSTASVEEMNASIGSVATISARREEAARGLVSVTKTGGAAIDETNVMIRDIAEQIHEITDIVGIINTIASQTNLLSMNAAIEAAHAGAAGKGFAVVAEEIRRLAESTNENSKKIKRVIKGISGRFDDVLAMSDKSKLAFVAVDGEVASTSSALSEISAAMTQLSAGSTEIMSAMQELDGIARGLLDESRTMKSGTDAVLVGIQNIEQIGSIVKSGMDEIAIGAKDVSAAMTHVNELQGRSGDSVEKLLDEVSCFRTVNTSTEKACADAAR